jgi:2-polyprenyl-3-methyl-5-hydroxy-6-metoxy-1,4-benzoquinol methylase
VTGCCARDYEKLFSGKAAERDARRFRKHGVRGSARALVGLAGDVRGATVLEVGGGVGGIELTLLDAGASRATNIELSSTYEQSADKLLAEHGLADRVDRRVGDFVAEADEIEPHDVVVMHRVICCYPDVDALVGAAGERARGRLLLTYPQQRAFVRLGAAAANLVFRLSGSTFRLYVHRRSRIDAAAGRHGLAPAETVRHGLLWESTAFAR